VARGLLFSIFSMKTMAQTAALVAAITLTLTLTLTVTVAKAHALAESFVGTYHSTKSKTCVPNTLTVVRSQKGVELKLNYPTQPEPQVIKFVYGRSREISGGGQLQHFISAPNETQLRLVRSETDYRNHPVSVLSITLTKTQDGLRFRSVARNASESPMSCVYKNDLKNDLEQ
jgi:hypothetical protein